MEVTDQTHYKLSERALSQKLEDELVILDGENGQYYTLNPMATQIVDALAQGSSVGELIDGLQHEYDVETTELVKDVHEVLTYLTQKALLEVQEEA